MNLIDVRRLKSSGPIISALLFAALLSDQATNRGGDTV